MLKQKMYEAVDGLLERIANEPDADDARANSAAVESLVRAAGDPGALDWLDCDSGGDGAPAAPRLSDAARAALRALFNPVPDSSGLSPAQRTLNELVSARCLPAGALDGAFRELNDFAS